MIIPVYMFESHTLVRPTGTLQPQARIAGSYIVQAVERIINEKPQIKAYEKAVSGPHGDDRNHHRGGLGVGFPTIRTMAKVAHRVMLRTAL